MIGFQELFLIFLIVLILFGGKKLPELARSLGIAFKEFRKAIEKEGEEKEVENDRN